MNRLYIEVRMGYTWEPYIGVVYGSKNGLYMGAVYRSRIWKQEWATCESNNGLYIGAIHGSKNGPYMRVIIGYIWELYMGAVYGSKNGPHVRVIMGYIWELYIEVRMGHM